MRKMDVVLHKKGARDSFFDIHTHTRVQVRPAAPCLRTGLLLAVNV